VKILLDALQSSNLSGTGSYATALMTYLPGAMTGSEIHAACPAAVSEQWKGKGLAGVVPCSAAGFPLGTVRRSAEMRAALRRIRPDIVHYPANFARWAGRGGVSAAKVVLTVHDLTFLRDPEWFTWPRAAYYRASIRPSVRLADLIIADSHATAGDLEKFLGVPRERCVVVPLGVGEELKPADAGEVKRARLKYGLPERFFLYLGTIEPRKNLPRLIEAFDRIAATTDFHLVIAGREGWKADATRRAHAEAAYGARIHFPGFVRAEEMAAVMTAATAFVWPSLWEGFGLPPLEAMACGVPVITSNTSSLPEVAGDAALLVNPDDAGAIATAMKRLAADGDLRARLRAGGLERARALTWRRTAELTAAAYRRVLGP
jgi:glycosyltransferase involved in cell wall biosynthesis